MAPPYDFSMAFKADTLSHIYRALLDELLRSPYSEVNKRTGVEIKMLAGGCSFKLDLSNHLLPVVGSRKLFPHVAAAEIAWFLRGDQDTAFLNAHGVKIWDKFTEPGTDIVDAAYGYRWRKKFGRDQIALAVEALNKNSTDRRVWVQAWDPSSDGLGAEGQRNVPCPVGFTFSIVDNQLHSSLFIRSSDVFVGLPYDIMGHAILMAAIGASTGCMGLGTLHVTLAHPHIYESHYEMASASVAGLTFPRGPALLAYPVDLIEHDPDKFVQAYREVAKTVEWPTYSPKPELIL